MFLLSVATATIERVFSTVKLIMCILRDRMDNDLINNCGVPHVEKIIFNTIYDDSIMNMF